VAFIRNTLALSRHTKNETLIHALQPLLVIGTLLMIYLFAPDGYLEHNFFPLIYTIGFLWSRNIITMQLNYVTKSKLSIWNYPFLIYLLGHLALCIYSANSDVTAAELHIFALSMAIIQVLFWIEFVVSVILQMKHVLGIDVFCIQNQVKGVKPENS
jgi:hypothetical protein